MPSHSEQQVSPYSVEQIYALVAEVERYPEFIPWCTATRIIRRGESDFDAELRVRFKGISESYVSRVELTPPDETGAHVRATLLHGPFAHLVNDWTLTRLPNETCQIDFFLDFDFRTKLLQMLIGALYEKATSKMIDAFNTRAHQLYGPTKA